MDRIKTEELTGAQILIRCLQAEGVEVVFGYPGGAVLWIYDELFKQDKVRHVLVRHEQGAAHAADGYSRSSDKVGVCLVTSGPGLTNAVTGIATAYMDSIPMIVISGQVPDARHRRGRVPGMRHGRHHAALREAQLPRARREGLCGDDEKGVPHRHHRAPGPVLVDIPKDVTGQQVRVPATRKPSACARTTR
jgi:acetolactate synthase-1/2/3 large subunit